MLSVALLNMVPCGIVVLNAKARILFTNTFAANLLRTTSDLCADKGFLRARSIPHSRALSDALAHLVHSERPEPVGFSIARSNRCPLSIALARLAPLPGKTVPKPENVRIAAILSDPERNIRPSASLIRDLFQFTPVESSIAVLMMESVDTARIAEGRGISRDTIREHLKLMFPKVNAKNQIELLHILLHSPASFLFPASDLVTQDLPPT